MKDPGRPPQPLTMHIVEEGHSRRVARVELRGENVYRLSLANALRISQHVGAQGLIGLAMDWRECVMTHNVTELTEVAAAFGEHLPTDVRFAVVHRPDQLAYAIQMTRSLARQGRSAHAFTVPADALGWLELNDDPSEATS